MASTVNSAFGFPANIDEEETSASIVALITSGVHDENPSIALREIHHLLSISGGAHLLDPLNSLPLLISSTDAAARDILDLMGECSNARETLIAAQEVLERLESTLLSEAGSDDEGEKPRISPTQELIALVSIYSRALPRLKLRARTALQTLEALLPNLRTVIELLSGRKIMVDDGRSLLVGVCSLVVRSFDWAVAISDEASKPEIRRVLLDLLEITVQGCAQTVRSALAQRTFEKLLPKFTIRSAVELGWEAGEEVAYEINTTWTHLGLLADVIPPQPSITSIVVLAHTSLDLPDPAAVLKSHLSALLSSIQGNMAADESLALLLTCLHKASTTAPSTLLPSEVIIPLSTLLPSLASAHPSPQTRHLTFRILSLLLSLAPPPVRLELLRDLTTDPDFSQMRVASVGLLKEAILDALSRSSTNSELFASPIVLQTFVPIVFRASPSALLTSNLATFENSGEAKRLVESLSLYYILLRRDQSNDTGIQSADVQDNINKLLLEPLKASLETWSGERKDEGHESHDHDHLFSSLQTLQMALERVDEALARGAT